MDIDLLRTFLEVNRTRHFARAADNLFVTSAAVSARIKQLETHLGVGLFIRHRGNMQLTHEGERLVPLAETMIDTWQRAMQEVSLHAEADTRIHIGATTSMWMFALQDRLLNIVESRPDIAVQAEGHSHQELTRRLEDRTLDLVLLPDPLARPGIQSVRVGELSLVLAATPPTKLPDAVANRYVYVDWGTAFATWHATRIGEMARPYLHVNFASIAIRILLARGGAAFLPRSTVESSAGLARVPGSPMFRRAIFACYREANDRVATIESVVSQLSDISV